MTLTVLPSHPFLAASEPDIDLFPVSAECTVSQAAEFLDVSVDFVRELLEDELVLSRRENGECLIEWNSLRDYEQDCRRMRAGVAEMIRMDQEMGLYDD